MADVGESRVMNEVAERTAIDRALDSVMTGLGELVVALVSAGRFDAMGTIALVGDQLQRVRKQTAIDYLRREQNGNAIGPNGVRLCGVGGFDVAQPWYGGAMNIGGAQPVDDMHQLHREAMLTVEKQGLANKPVRDAETAASEAQELLSLRNVIRDLSADAPERQALESRMRTLVASIGARANGGRKDGTDAELVHPHLPRGHQVGEDERRHDHGASLRAHADGGARDADPPREGAVIAHALGYVV